MENFETAKVKALGRVKLLTVVLFLLILLGAYIEWQKANKPLDEAIVVYKVMDNKTVAKENNSPALEVVADKISEVEVKQKMAVSEESLKKDTSDNQVVESKNANVVGEFLRDIDVINAKLDEIEKSESALDKIIPFEVKKVEDAKVVVFEENKIEIYDDKKGVVKVEDAPVVSDSKEKVEETKEKIVEDVKSENTHDDGYDVTLEEVNASIGEVSKEESNQDANTVEDMKSETVKEVITMGTTKEEGTDADKEVVKVEDAVKVEPMNIKESIDIVEDVENRESEKVKEIVNDMVLAEEKAKEEILNISVDDDIVEVNEIENLDIGDDKSEKEVNKDKSFDGVKMRINENGISFVGEDGVEVKIDEGGIQVNNPVTGNIKINDNGVVIKEVVDDESGKIIVDRVEPIVNTEKSGETLGEVYDDDAPINLLKGIAEDK